MITRAIRSARYRLTDTPLAGDLLRLMAWYGPDDIPTALLTDLAEEPLLRKAIGRLTAYSMITHNEAAISVHRLVQAVTRTPDPEDPHRSPDQTSHARDAAAHTLAQRVGTLDPRTPSDWPALRALLTHSEALARHTNEATDTHDTLIVLDRAGVFLREHGQLEDAVRHLRRCHTGCERIHGPDHPNTLGSGNNLAYAYHVGGDVERAIPCTKPSSRTPSVCLAATTPFARTFAPTWAMRCGSAERQAHRTICPSRLGTLIGSSENGS